MKANLLIILIPLFFFSCKRTEKSYDGNSQYESFTVESIPFVVADTPWNADMLGNHRAVVSLKQPDTNAVLVELPWRRPDLKPETKKIIVVNAKTQQPLNNVAVLSISAEKGILAFQPNDQSTDYYIYYLPYKFRSGYDDARYGKPWNDYLPPIYSADTVWKQAVEKNSKHLPLATIKRFESRTKFDFFTPMGIIATAEEQNKMKANHPKAEFLLFPEDRAFPIRPLKQLPWRWVAKGPTADFVGYADKNEYYTWQVGVWATGGAVKNLRVTFSDLVSGDEVIKKEAITCFNQEGTGWDGKPLTFHVDVPANGIQALWNGVQIPEKAKAGEYTGTMRISAANMKAQTIQISLHVGDEVLADKGDDDLWRHARLRWLNSTIGTDNLPVEPYAAMKLTGHHIEATGKTVQVGGNGLPESISINNRSVLAKPMTFKLEMPNKDIVFLANDVTIEKTADGLVKWKASALHDGISFTCNAYMEYDGYIRYQLKLAAKEPIEVNNIKLETAYGPEASTYFMGAGFKGGFTPHVYSWDWKGPWDSYWIGGDLAGLHMEFRGGAYHGPLLNDYKPAPPATWANDGKGKIRLQQNAYGGADVIAATGKKTISKDTLDFEFATLITPVKPVNTAKHFSERYYHATPSGFNKAAQDGANIANIHHATKLNPIINYPFTVQDSLITFINEQHRANRKVKLYYTVRELTNYVTELYALKSLNHEVFVSGVGFGTPWQMEHLIDDYKPAWYSELPGQNADAALVLNGFSRWINYYLEGLRWMYEHYKIDGIYMDDVSFDRTVMKRMRKIAAQYRPGALVDLHSNTGYSIGPANQYTDFFPYVDRLWFGESFKYNEMMPDEWFVTFSGIPFGQMSEMLQDGGNRFLGMVYGATARHSYGKFSPTPVWNLWKSFGIEQAKMIGYWDKNKLVETANPTVKATVYQKPDKALIAIGNFDKNERHVHLTINWAKLGFDPKHVKIEAPAIADFQVNRTFTIGQEIPIKAKEGIILLITPIP